MSSDEAFEVARAPSELVLDQLVRYLVLSRPRHHGRGVDCLDDDLRQARSRLSFATNVDGVIATVQAALVDLPSDGGRVINVSSLIVSHVARRDRLRRDEGHRQTLAG